MSIKVITEKLLLRDRKDVVRIHLYSKLLHTGVVPYEKDLDVLITLYEIGGYSNESEQLKFFNTCISRKYKKSIQSIRNTLAKYTEVGLLEKPRNKKRFISDSWLPVIDSEKIVLDYKISHN